MYINTDNTQKGYVESEFHYLFHCQTPHKAVPAIIEFSTDENHRKTAVCQYGYNLQHIGNDRCLLLPFHQLPGHPYIDGGDVQKDHISFLNQIHSGFCDTTLFLLIHILALRRNLAMNILTNQHSTSVCLFQQSLCFQCAEVFTNQVLTNGKPLTQLLDLYLSIGMQLLHNGTLPLLYKHVIDLLFFNSIP